jgi:predicted DNA-binding protein
VAVRNSHQTTIRFTEEMWSALEHAAHRLGISVAHYVRDAARARLDDENQRMTSSAVEALRQRDAFERSLEGAEGSAALWQQGRLARERAQMLRAESRKQRGTR